MEEESFIGAFGDVPEDLAGRDSTLYVFRVDDFGDWRRRVRNAHERELAEQQDSLTVGMTPMTDENMAEAGWVRGPLDADGKMWRSGDMSDSNWGVIEGIAYEDGQWLVRGHDTSAPWMPADSIRHHHAPTVEDVLREFTDEVWNRCCEGATASDSGIDELVAECAARLRLAGGEDA